MQSVCVLCPALSCLRNVTDRCVSWSRICKYVTAWPEASSQRQSLGIVILRKDLLQQFRLSVSHVWNTVVHRLHWMIGVLFYLVSYLIRSSSVLCSHPVTHQASTWGIQASHLLNPALLYINILSLLRVSLLLARFSHLPSCLPIIILV